MSIRLSLMLLLDSVFWGMVLLFTHRCPPIPIDFSYQGAFKEKSLVGEIKQFRRRNP